MSKKRNRSKRPLYFRILKRLMKCRYKSPTFIYLGERFEGGALILSNHEGTDAPMSLEMYCDTPVRMWGTGEMNSGLIKLYRYQSKYYYAEKKHWNIHLARLFCLIASPLTWLFYAGFDLISTYEDARIVKTVRESVASLKSGENIVIYPEDSRNGYLEELEGFHEGFALLGDVCLKQGLDVPVYVSYFRKSDKTYIFDAPVMYSELKGRYKTRTEIARHLCDRCNELGRMYFDENKNLIEDPEAKHA